jgi:hypothetical protein
MRLLLDTHALIWWLSTFERLREEALDAIRDPGNEVFVSAASAWELAIKAGSGKAPLPADLQSCDGSGAGTDSFARNVCTVTVFSSPPAAPCSSGPCAEWLLVPSAVDCPASAGHR